MTQIKTSRMLAPALAMTAVASAPAEAVELTYVDRDDVYAENLDGSARHSVSTDGTSARPYVLPTADEQGGVAALQASAETGQQGTSAGPTARASRFVTGCRARRATQRARRRPVRACSPTAPP